MFISLESFSSWLAIFGKSRESTNNSSIWLNNSSEKRYQKYTRVRLKGNTFVFTVKLASAVVCDTITPFWTRRTHIFCTNRIDSTSVLTTDPTHYYSTVITEFLFYLHTFLQCNFPHLTEHKRTYVCLFVIYSLYIMLLWINVLKCMFTVNQYIWPLFYNLCWFVTSCMYLYLGCITGIFFWC